MELLLLGIFAAALLLCVFSGISIIYAMILGLVLFFAYGLVKKKTWKQMLVFSWQGVKTAKNILLTFLLIGMARPLFSIFLQEEEVMAIGVNYLRIVGLSQMFMMVEQTSIGAFSGLGRTLYPSIVSVTFTSARIPVAVLLSSVMGLSGIWWALSISSMVKGCILFVSFVVFLYVFLERKKDEKTV